MVVSASNGRETQCSVNPAFSKRMAWGCKCVQVRVASRGQCSLSCSGNGQCQGDGGGKRDELHFLSACVILGRGGRGRLVGRIKMNGWMDG